jgi:putative oxidoreductase
MPLAIATEAGCALLILIGYQARAAALLLAGFCIVTAVLFHSKLGNRNELLHFEKDLAIAGGLLVLFARGAGHWAIDALWPVWRASQNPAATAKVPSLPQS